MSNKLWIVLAQDKHSHSTLHKVLLTKKAVTEYVQTGWGRMLTLWEVSSTNGIHTKVDVDKWRGPSCVVCSKQYRRGSTDYLRIQGNIYAGESGGIIGDNFIHQVQETSAINSTYCCRNIGCLSALLPLNKGDGVVVIQKDCQRSKDAASSKKYYLSAEKPQEDE